MAAGIRIARFRRTVSPGGIMANERNRPEDEVGRSAERDDMIGSSDDEFEDIDELDEAEEEEEMEERE
jgi:hypothetical protein